ncbi:MAG TPA: choloylglycine hydrolase family protein, partial [Candidatus Binataceae bacterium]|nr:choloylglycine hydrolase family protein [Candidatus Binataceae bacterium]
MKMTNGVFESHSHFRAFKRSEKVLVSTFVAICVCTLLFGNVVQACTGIRLKAGDGTVVYARTLEFGVDLQSEVLVVPRRYSRTGSTPDGKNGLKWTSKYASVGTNGEGLPILLDGVNEKGLGVGLFYFPTAASYAKYSPAKAAKTIAPWELGSWLLENFATVDEVKRNIGSIVVADVVLKEMGYVPPVHVVVHDASGRSIVIEYVDGRLHVYDDLLGVITNAPSFDWQMTNLRNYVNFSIVNVPPVHLGPITLVGFGQGTGMLGLPGDITPPARFVRAVAYTSSVLPSATGDDAVLQAFHILNNFDIPKGSAREDQKDQYGNIIADYTLWTAASNLKERKYYFRTYQNSQIRS